MHTVLAGGVGAARYLLGALEAFDPSTVTAVVNVGDDVVLHGLHISPDLDTCTYTLAGAIDPERGWGLVDETWQAMAELGRYGGDNWFGRGDHKTVGVLDGVEGLLADRGRVGAVEPDAGDLD